MINYYDILGVSRDSKPAEIRAAFIALMKQHHPDAADDREAAEQAKEINRAFTILRNPATRARYDEQLGRAARETAPRAAHYPVFVPPRPLRPRPRRGRWMLKLLVVAAPLVAGGLLYRELERREAPASVSAPEEPAGTEPYSGRAPTVRRADVRDAMADYQWVATNGGAGEAMRFSRACFEGLGREPSFRRADRCIAFDLAWLRRRTAAPAGETPLTADFFSPDAVSARHREALRRLPGDGGAEEARLGEIDRLTISEMARLLAPPPSTP